MFWTSDQLTEFAQRLAEERPSAIYSVAGTHTVEYMDGTNGPVAIIDIDIPDAMTATLENGTTGTLKSLNIALPKQEDE